MPGRGSGFFEADGSCRDPYLNARPALTPEQAAAIDAELAGNAELIAEFELAFAGGRLASRDTLEAFARRFHKLPFLRELFGLPPLRTDGPTLEEFVAAGYAAENYPPLGYAPRVAATPVVRRNIFGHPIPATGGLGHGATHEDK